MRHELEECGDFFDKLDEYDDVIEATQLKEQKVLDDLVGFNQVVDVKKKIALPEIDYEYFDVS